MMCRLFSFFFDTGIGDILYFSAETLEDKIDHIYFLNVWEYQIKTIFTELL
jgi:hypothetical protein